MDRSSPAAPLALIRAVRSRRSATRDAMAVALVANDSDAGLRVERRTAMTVRLSRPVALPGVRRGSGAIGQARLTSGTMSVTCAELTITTETTCSKAGSPW